MCVIQAPIRSEVLRSASARPRGWRGRCRRRGRRRCRRRARAAPSTSSTTGWTPTILKRLPTSPTRDAEHAAADREQHGLDEELAEDVGAPRAERLADADLARPLGDGDEHDVHDADPADEQRDRGDGGEQHREDVVARGGRLQQRGLVEHAEGRRCRSSECVGVRIDVASALAALTCRRLRLDDDLAEAAGDARDEVLRRRQRRDRRCRPGPGSRSCPWGRARRRPTKPMPLSLIVWPSGFDAAEQVLDDGLAEHDDARVLRLLLRR